MALRGGSLMLGGLLLAGLWLGAAAPASGQDINRYYHYPFYSFPHNYAPNYSNWPDHRLQFQPAPAYMAYPPYLDSRFRYDLFQNLRYHRGHHFFLDQF
jgi:hypothetical protein